MVPDSRLESKDVAAPLEGWKKNKGDRNLMSEKQKHLKSTLSFHLAKRLKL